MGTGPGPDATLPLPGLLFGAPALLGLVLVLVLVTLVIWRWQRQRRMASPDTPDGVQEGENHVWGSAMVAGVGDTTPIIGDVRNQTQDCGGGVGPEESALRLSGT